MQHTQQPLILPAGVSLRTELSLRGLKFAAQHQFLYERTDGQVPGILFGRGEDGRHGNFHPLSYRQICGNAQWAKRLQKAHTGSRRAWPRANWHWKELDCANSSDALLMNIFCHPEVMKSTEVRAMLGTEAGAELQFGFRPRIPLLGNKFDNTEIDMTIGALMVEAKLTESNFQRARTGLVSRYRDLETVFDISELPSIEGKHDGYQLVRGTLAAYATGGSFCVLCDSRRPDLMESWYRIMRVVRPFELRCRLKLLTWQELSECLPADLQQFLADKYGIVSNRLKI